jgi:hypothetical protein
MQPSFIFAEDDSSALAYKHLGDAPPSTANLCIARGSYQARHGGGAATTPPLRSNTVYAWNPGGWQSVAAKDGSPRL